MAENQKKPSPFKELGVTGRSQFGEAHVIETDATLSGPMAIQTYDNMRRTDPTGMAMQLVLSLPIRSVQWRCEPGGEKTQADIDAADFVWSCFNDMSLSLSDFISDICLMFPYGWAQFWMVMKRRTAATSQFDDGRVGWKKMEMVNPRSLVDWEYWPNGDIKGPLVTTSDNRQVLVPLKGSLYFRTWHEGDAPEGVSIYRAAVRSYKYKHRFEQIEGRGLYLRWAGFPIAHLPVGATSNQDVEPGVISDEARAEQLIQAIYEDRMMGASLPDGWGLDFGGPQGNVDNTMGDTIMRKDIEMARAILAQFMLQGLRRVGTQSLAGTLFDAFILALEAYLADIRQEFNRYAIPALLRWNSFPGMTGPPTMEHTTPRTLDLGAVARYLGILTGRNLLTPDSATEGFLRSLVPGMPTEVAERQEVVEDEEDQGDVPEVPDEEAVRSASRLLHDLDLGKGFARGLTERDYESYVRAHFYATKPAPDNRPTTYRLMADRNAMKQRENLESWTNSTGAEVSQLEGDISNAELGQKLDDYILAGLLLFRERSMLDIVAAFWLGFGGQSTEPDALNALADEIALADQWIGFGPGGTVARTNPQGKPTLFGDIAGELEGQIAAILLLLKQGRRGDVAGLVADAVKAATRGYSRGALYAGHVWRSIWVGADQRRRQDGEDGPVRWVMDILAEHCTECPIYGDHPPGRQYASMDALLSLTRGTLPGYGTECDGSCRCHLEKQMPDGSWGWM